jgi:UPF0288 family protein (methanogenesis marker protein 3)
MMAAIAISKTDEARIERLQKKLRVRSKSGVVRLAVEELERRIEDREMAGLVHEYVQKYGILDREENKELGPAAVARRGS